MLLTENAKTTKNEYMREYRKENAEKLKKYQREYRKAHPQKVTKWNNKYWNKKAAQKIDSKGD